MKTTVRQQGTSTIVAIHGEINTPDVETFRQVVTEAYERGSGHVVIDAEELTYLNSAAIGIIAGLQRLVAAYGDSLRPPFFSWSRICGRASLAGRGCGPVASPACSPLPERC